MSLDRYLAKNTSEDNASFEEMIREAEKKQKIKDAWLYEQEEAQDKVSGQRSRVKQINVLHQQLITLCLTLYSSYKYYET